VALAQRLLRGWQEPLDIAVARLGSRRQHKNNSYPMNSPNAFFIGIDRSDKHLDFTVLDGAGELVERGKVSTDPAALHPWMERWRNRGAANMRVVVAFEQPAPNLVVFFSQFEGVVIYPLNPAAVRSYCRSFAVSNAHSDRTDAAMIARYTFHYHGELRALERASGPMRHLRSLVEHRRTLVDERTVLTNRLQALLKLYFPQALKLLSEDLWRPMNCEFLLRWPSLQALGKARPSTLDAFWAAHGSRSEKRLRERLDLLAGASALTEDADTIAPLVLRVESLARQLQVLAHSLEVVERRIEQLAATFDDYAFFRALPGAGCAFAPRLLAAYGDSRSRWPSASALLCYCGIAPVTRQSGNTRCVVRRLHCPNFLRQSFHEWSAESWKHSRWARAFVRYHQSRGKSFHTIIRMLAYKWIKILTRAWHDRQLYDEERYLQCLIRRGSPICKYLGE
jgi:transposase